MSCLYIVVYNAPDISKIGKIYNNNSTTINFINSVNQHQWHYDIGDDPSFYSFNQGCGNELTWGICRTNIRNKLQPNDVVLYYSFCSTCNSYFLTGFATVKEKIKQTDIWVNNSYSMLQKYFNLLIKNGNSIWSHDEPLFQPKHIHKDWVRRITINVPNQVFTTNNIDLTCTYSINNNYVIFESNVNDTYILKNQIQVASWKTGDKTETWNPNKLVKDIRDITFIGSNRKTLRVHDRNQAHPHIKIEFDNNKLIQWKKDFITLVNHIDI